MINQVHKMERRLKEQCAQNRRTFLMIDYRQLLVISDCPSSVNVTPSDEPFKEGDVLTCTSDGYPQPSYSWTDADGVVVSTTSEVALSRGVFNLTCTATGNFTTPCSASFTASGNASGKMQCSWRDLIV